MSVLVTGGAGFIGSHVVDRLLESGEEVVVIDSLDPQVHPSMEWPDYLDERAHRIQGDCGSYAALYQAGEIVETPITIVIHLAAAVGVGQSAYEISRYVSANVSATASLLQWIVDQKTVQRIVTAGSMSCYGEGLYGSKWGREERKGVARTPDAIRHRQWDNVVPDPYKPEPVGLTDFDPIPTHEGVELVCSSVYAETKRAQEELTRLVGSQRGISWAVARFFNTYGPRQSVQNPYTGVAAIFSSQIRSGKGPTIYEDGDQSRDFIHVSDVADAVMTLAFAGDAEGIYNVGTGTSTSIRDLAETLLDLYGKTMGVQIRGTYRAGDIRHCFADSSKLRGLGWSPQISLRDGLADLVEWVEGEQVVDRTERAHEQLTDHGLVT